MLSLKPLLEKNICAWLEGTIENMQSECLGKWYKIPHLGRQGEVPQTSLRSWETHVEISACQRTDILAAKKEKIRLKRIV